MNAPLAAETAMLAMSAMQRECVALDRGIVRAMASVAPALAHTEAAMIEAGARLVINQPRERWRITRAVYGPSHVGPAWPPRPGMTATDVLAECHHRLRIQEGFNARREWHLFDRSRWIALRQAEVVLLAIITSED